jgi:acetyl-CoA decarbonylase/synthase complex subunit gamma
MKLAAKQVELASCPHISEEAKEALAAAAAPPIRLVTVGAGERAISVGEEVVLYRHDKTFYHPPGLFIRVKDVQPLEEVEELVAEVDSYSVERVGLKLTLNGIAIENASREKETFVRCVEAVKKGTKLPLILMSDDPDAMEACLEITEGMKPLIYAAKEDNWQAFADLAKRHKAPLTVYAEDLSSLADLAQRVKSFGVHDIVLDPGTRGMGDSLAAFTQIRRLALKKSFRPLGFPIISFPGEGARSDAEEAILASQHIAKYGGLVVLDRFDPTFIYPLLTLRLNIYTDPQKPIQVSPGIYEINEPRPDSPLLVTTNFSLTYFSVAGEVEGAGFPSWLLIVDTEGLSVLTSWAAGKFDAEAIAKAVRGSGIEGKISHRKIVIPGFVAPILGDLEEELPGWEVLVGPREAVDLPAYLKIWGK